VGYPQLALPKRFAIIEYSPLKGLELKTKGRIKIKNLKLKK
jgi:hypothetical protein